jgi:hypothetical protein
VAHAAEAKVLMKDAVSQTVSEVLTPGDTEMAEVRTPV